jgi:hypothetical protein
LTDTLALPASLAKPFAVFLPGDVSLSSNAIVDAQWTLAESIAAQAFADGGPLKGKCPTANEEDLCLETFLQTSGALLLRRPLTDAERTKARALFKSSSLMSSDERLSFVLRYLVLSPSFLHVVEKPSAANQTVTPLSGYELATRLSLLLWDASPDAMLLAAAAAGELASPEGRSAQFRRMVASPKHDRFQKRLFETWLHYQDIRSAVKHERYAEFFQPGVADAMVVEAEAFFQRVYEAPSSSFASLFTSRETQIDASLAKIYGLPAPAQPKAVVTLPSETRSGFLSQPWFLASKATQLEGSAVFRGLFLIEKVFCIKLTAPADIPPLSDTDAQAPRTQRERLAIHRKPACAGCHTQIDGIGLGLENFDTVGRFQTHENGVLLTGEGEWTDESGNRRSYRGVGELASLIAASSPARRCFMTHWFDAATHRKPTRNESADFETNVEAFLNDGNMKQLVERYARSASFATRQFHTSGAKP